MTSRAGWLNREAEEKAIIFPLYLFLSGQIVSDEMVYGTMGCWLQRY
jgi:hypothetical protein